MSLPRPPLPDPNGPREGDVVTARFHWSSDPEEEGRHKMRPCLVIKAAQDGSKVILAPISTVQNLSWTAKDCIEVAPESREAAGLDPDRRSFIKLTEVNAVELPSRAIIPGQLPDGRLSWRRGEIDRPTLERVQKEISYRVHDKSLMHRRIAAEPGLHLRPCAIRVLRRAAVDERTFPGDGRQARLAAVTALASQRAEGRPAGPACTASQR